MMDYEGDDYEDDRRRYMTDACSFDKVDGSIRILPVPVGTVVWQQRLDFFRSEQMLT
jgi:hypothetical protein